MPANDDNLNESISQVERPTPDPQFVASLRRRMAQTHQRQFAQPDRDRRRRRWWRVGSLTSSSIAAALLLVLLFWPTTPSGFAQAQMNLRQTEAVSFRTRIVTDYVRLPRQTLSMRTLWMPQRGIRHDVALFELTLISCVHRPDGRTWVHNHVSDTLANSVVDSEPLFWLEHLDPETLLDRLCQRTGVKARVIDHNDQNITYRLTGQPLHLPNHSELTVRIDAKTKYIEEVRYDLPPSELGQISVVIDSFDWSPQLTADALTPPANAKPVPMRAIIPRPSEQTLLRSLETFGRMTGGYYPGHGRATPYLFMMMQALHNHGPADGPQIDMAQDLMAGLLFLLNRSRYDDMKYHGHRVTRQNADRELASWDTRNGRRVIYGDLRIKTLKNP